MISGLQKRKCEIVAFIFILLINLYDVGVKSNTLTYLEN